MISSDLGWILRVLTVVVDVADVVEVAFVVAELAVVAVVAVVAGLATLVGWLGLDDCARMDCDVRVNDKSSSPLIFRLMLGKWLDIDRLEID